MGEKWPISFAYTVDFHVNVGIFDKPQNCDRGSPASAWFEPANLGTRGQHANH
jgi:hypothetical protein